MWERILPAKGALRFYWFTRAVFRGQSPLPQGSCDS
jgi:hypothetical protein